MIKPVTLVLCSLFLLPAAVALAPDAPASAPADDAVAEAVRRQAYTLELRQKLEAAQNAEQRKDLMAASKIYEACVELSQKIGTAVDAEMQMAVAGLTNVRIEMARQAQKVDDLREADVQIRAVLRVNPKSTAALEFKRENDRLLAQQAGRIPSVKALETLPDIRTNRVAAATLVQDGKLMWEMGKPDEAEVKLRRALEIDPDNKAAFYYLSLIKESQFGRAVARRDADTRTWLVDVEQAWERPVQRDLLPKPNPFARTNLVYTGQGRQNIISKLGRIRLNEVKYDGLELSEVVRNLNDETKKRDPDKAGINYLILADSVAAAPPAPAAIDPTTGQPIASAPVAEPVDLGGVKIRINPALTDICLADVLDAIVKTAATPIKYSVEDYAIVFSAKAAEPVPLYTRQFKVDPNTFYQGLEGVGAFVFGETSGSTGGGGGGGGGGRGGGGGGSRGGGGQGNQVSGAIISRVSAAPGQITGGRSGGGGGGAGGGAGGGGFRFLTQTNVTAEVSAAAKNFFTTLGVDLTPPKVLFFNDRQGTLLVRATLQDLDLIEAAIQVLCVVPPQVNIKAKFLEISQNDNKAIGFDWYLGNVRMNGGSIVGQGGTAPSYSGDATHPTFPGPGSPTTILPRDGDQMITQGLRNAPTSLFTLTGILTDPQFRVVLHALEQRDGTEVLAAPEVTTVSGRQAQMKAAEVKTVITSFDFNQQVAGGVSTPGSTTTGGGGAVGSSFVYPIPEQMELGPVLDVIPCVLSDGYTINLTLIPTVTAFVGYDNPNEVLSAGVLPQDTVLVPTVLPRFQVRQVVSTVNVWDGQTVALGGVVAENTSRIKDKVPVLGDLPFFGRFFRSESTSTQKKNLLIFVTPTLIDPAGNRLHSAEELPFAQTAIPAQSAVPPSIPPASTPPAQ